MPYSMNQVRECLWCETPIEGRADKQFCSSSCKAYYNRENAGQLPVEPPQPKMPARLPRPNPMLATARPPLDDESGEDEYGDTETEDFDVQYQRLEKERLDREKAAELHKCYSNLVDEFLRDEGICYDEAALNDFINDLDEAAITYRQHPGLLKSEHPAHTRIADLYLMTDYLRGLRKAMQEADKAADSFFGRSEPEPTCLEISKKHRKRLRTNLLGEK